MEEQARRCSLADTGSWANQNVVFARALEDMFPLAKAILKGALARDECRGAHYKPEFAMPEIDAADPAERRRQAEHWCRAIRGEQSEVAEDDDRHALARRRAALSYEDVDTSLIPPRPRLYGVAGGDMIEEVWKQREAAAAAP